MSRILLFLSFGILNARNLSELFMQEGLPDKVTPYLDCKSLLNLRLSSSLLNDETYAIKAKLYGRVLDIRYEMHDRISELGASLDNLTDGRTSSINPLLEDILEDIVNPLLEDICFLGDHCVLNLIRPSLREMILLYFMRNECYLLREFFTDFLPEYNDAPYRYKILTNLIKINSISRDDKYYHGYLFNILRHIYLFEFKPIYDWIMDQLEEEIYTTFSYLQEYKHRKPSDLFSLVFHILPKIFDEDSDRNIKIKDYISLIKPNLLDLYNTILPIISSDAEIWKYGMKDDEDWVIFAIYPAHCRYKIMESHSDIRQSLLQEYYFVSHRSHLYGEENYTDFGEKLDLGILIDPNLSDQFYRVMYQIMLDVCKEKKNCDLFTKDTFHSFNS